MPSLCSQVSRITYLELHGDQAALRRLVLLQQAEAAAADNSDRRARARLLQGTRGYKHSETSSVGASTWRHDSWQVMLKVEGSDVPDT